MHMSQRREAKNALIARQARLTSKNIARIVLQSERLEEIKNALNYLFYPDADWRL